MPCALLLRTGLSWSVSLCRSYRCTPRWAHSPCPRKTRHSYRSTGVGGRDQEETTLLRRAREQLHAYFDGELRVFTLPVAPLLATSYRRRVWAALDAIPFGETRTYAELARIVGGCARSIGQANRHNPLPIIVPCHRVVAAGGIGGFSMDGGVDTKRFLLSLEQQASKPALVLSQQTEIRS